MTNRLAKRLADSTSAARQAAVPSGEFSELGRWTKTLPVPSLTIFAVTVVIVHSAARKTAGTGELLTLNQRKHQPLPHCAHAHRAVPKTSRAEALSDKKANIHSVSKGHQHATNNLTGHMLGGDKTNVFKPTR